MVSVLECHVRLYIISVVWYMQMSEVFMEVLALAKWSRSHSQVVIIQLGTEADIMAWSEADIVAREQGRHEASWPVSEAEYSQCFIVTVSDLE